MASPTRTTDRWGLLLHRLRGYLFNYIPVIAHTLAAWVPVALLHANGQIERALDPTLFLAAFVLGNLADIDTSQSHFGRLIPFVSKPIEHRFGHRTITHSFWPVLFLAIAAWTVAAWWQPAPWWLWATMYTTHLLLDMVVGVSGVPLFWPNPTRFYYLRKIKAGSNGERAIALLLFLTVFVLTWYGTPNPSEWIINASGSMEYAVHRYRELEHTHELIADIEATNNLSHEPIDGTFRVLGLTGNTFTLAIDGQPRTAGQHSDDDFYLRRILIQPAEQRTSYVVPTFTPTPVLVPVRIHHVTDLETEILVAVGDVVTEGQLLADLTAYKQRLQAQAAHAPILVPTATPTPTPTTVPTPTPDAMTHAQAWADLQLARAEATRAFAPPAPDEVAAVCGQLEHMRNQLWQAQLDRDALKVRANSGGISHLQIQAVEVGLMEQERQIAAQETLCHAISTRPHAADPADLQVAAARLQQAELTYARRIATPTPLWTPTPRATPTRPPLPTPTTAPDDVEIVALVSGMVDAVEIVAVTGNEATVEIRIAVQGDPAPALAALRPEAPVPLPNPPPDGELAYVIHVSDGDTLDVRFSDGSEERLRLLDVDTPETVHPNEPVQCYGPEASAHTKQRLCGNDKGKECVGIGVYVEAAGREKYGRLLAYVWTQDGALFNEELTALGLARYNDYGQVRQYSGRVAAAEEAARREGVGLWGACGVE